MIQKVNLFYPFAVLDEMQYSLNVRIGEGQPGDINVVLSTSPYQTSPTDNEQEWTTVLGNGRQLRDKKIILSSITKNENGLTDRVSVSVFINGIEIIPQAHSDDEDPNIKEVENGVIVQFIQKIVFL